MLGPSSTSSSSLDTRRGSTALAASRHAMWKERERCEEALQVDGTIHAGEEQSASCNKVEEWKGLGIHQGKETDRVNH